VARPAIELIRLDPVLAVEDVMFLTEHLVSQTLRFEQIRARLGETNRYCSLERFHAVKGREAHCGMSQSVGSAPDDSIQAGISITT
jgi:hypothetical protein